MCGDEIQDMHDRLTPRISALRAKVCQTEPKPLKRTWHDGSHCGLTDWYDTLEGAIKKALRRGPRARWTTGWYASKKEIASAKITAYGDRKIVVEASVSDDFDTPGEGSKAIPFTRDLDAIRDAITQAWEEAEDDQKNNRCYMGFSIHPGTGDKPGPWVETLILPTFAGHEMDSPPGDNYSEWGWQNDCKDVPRGVKAAMRRWAERWSGEESETFHNAKGDAWTIRAWKD